MNVLMIGNDPTLFEHGTEAFGDARRRHLLYARLLRGLDQASSLRILTYTSRASARGAEELADGLTFVPTRSLHRAAFVPDAIRRLPALLKGWRPDVITTQTPWEEGLLGLWLSRYLGVPFLPQLHFDVFSPYWRRESALNAARCRIARAVVRRASGIRVVSRLLAEKVASAWAIPRERIHVVPVGVHLDPAPVAPKDHYRARLSPDLTGKPVVLFVGRIVKQKNLDLWLQVARSVDRRLPGQHVQFVLAGGGPLLRQLERKVQRDGLGASVRFLGEVGHQRLPELYAAADLFLLTSHYEGFGRVIAESYLAGVPVVATACTGPEDVILEGKSGYLCAPGDEVALTARVSSLLEDPVRARQMGTLGRDHVERAFGLERLAERWINCWWRVVAECRASTA